MDRRHWLHLGALLAAGAAVSPRIQAQAVSPLRLPFSYQPGVKVAETLKAPEGRPIRAAFAINPGVQVIDLAGPWETFQDTRLRRENAMVSAFELYTVSEATAPVRASGGLSLIPHYSLANAPQPDVLVIPHFDQPEPDSAQTSAIHEWIRAVHARTALTMSICTGAFQFAKTELLDGLSATTNQMYYDSFAGRFPKVNVRRGPRFVETGRIATAGGLSAGIDLALRVVSRYFGDSMAERVSGVMEYAGTGWRD